MSEERVRSRLSCGECERKKRVYWSLKCKYKIMNCKRAKLFWRECTAIKFNKKGDRPKMYEFCFFKSLML